MSNSVTLEKKSPLRQSIRLFLLTSFALVSPFGAPVIGAILFATNVCTSSAYPKCSSVIFGASYFVTMAQMCLYLMFILIGIIWALLSMWIAIVFIFSAAFLTFYALKATWIAIYAKNAGHPSQQTEP